MLTEKTMALAQNHRLLVHKKLQETEYSNMNVFSTVLLDQKNNKKMYNNNLIPLGGFRIQIKNNQIVNIINGSGWVNPNRKKQYIMLILNVIKKYKLKDGNININLSDHPVIGVFNFCRIKNNKNYFLLPNMRFTYCDIKLSSEWIRDEFSTFEDTTTYLQNLHAQHNFENKINKFYTSCIPHNNKFDYFKFALNNINICDGYMYGGSCHKYLRIPEIFINECKKNGLAGEEFKYFVEHFKYKYIIYNDGNTLSDRTRLLLNVNSVIIKKKSEYEEFYSYLLENNENYIEYNRTQELLRIFEHLEQDTKLCNIIINNNVNFVKNILTYDNILEYTAVLLNNVIYFTPLGVKYIYVLYNIFSIILFQ